MSDMLESRNSYFKKIQKGEIDFFITDTINIHPLQFLIRVKENDMYFDFDAITVPNEFKIVSKKSDPFQSETISIDTIEFKQKLMIWLSHSINAFRGKLFPPKQYVILSDLVSNEILAAGQIVLNKSNLSWIFVEEGEAYLFGRIDLPPLARGVTFPLVEGLWFGVATELKFKLLTAESSITEDCINGIKEYTQWNIQRCCRDFNLNVFHEQQKLEKKYLNEKKALLNSVTALVKIINPKTNEIKIESKEQALLQVFQKITQLMSVNLPIVQEKELIAQSDPIDYLTRLTGLRKRQVKLSEKWWKGDHGPLLGFTKREGRAIALLPTSHYCYTAYDPILGSNYLITQEKANELQTQALNFYRSMPDKLLKLKDLVHFSKMNTLNDFLRIALMTCFMGVLTLFIPYGFGLLIRTIISDDTHKQLYWLIVFLMAGAIASACCQLVRGLSVLRIQGKTDNELQPAIWDRLLKLPMPFFRQYSVVGLGFRALAMNQIQLVFAGKNLQNILEGFLAIFYLIFITCYSLPIALMTVGLSFVLFLVTFFSGLKILYYKRREAHLLGKFISRAFEFFGGINKIRSACAESIAFRHCAKEYAAQQKNTYKGQVILCAVEAFNSAFPYWASLLLFLMFSVFLSEMSTSQSTALFLAINAAFGSLMGVILNLSGTLLQILTLVPLYERIKPILETVPEIDEFKIDPGKLEGSIEVQGLSFRYSELTPWILQDISLQISSGEYIAIVGASGAGKSTFLRLLLGFEMSNRGTIYYDNQDLGTIDATAVRRQIGVVLQTTQLTIGSIYENIIGASHYTIDDAKEALRLAGLEEIVNKLPMGIHTFVYEEGGALSGGEKQRIAIARALVGKPNILFMDEATSSLDNASQAKITNTISQLAATRIVLAHRLSTVQQADRILVFKEGRIVEMGTFAKLMESGIEFKALAKQQLL